jgi:hypothetical protein
MDVSREMRVPSLEVSPADSELLVTGGSFLDRNFDRKVLAGYKTANGKYSPDFILQGSKLA